MPPRLVQRCVTGKSSPASSELIGPASVVNSNLRSVRVQMINLFMWYWSTCLCDTAVVSFC